MLELRNISFSAGNPAGNKEILRNIDLTFEDNQFIVITGPNGSGKSTLAKLIAGIEVPSGGNILLDGVDITQKDITERAQLGISYAFQQPVKFKGITVFELLRIASAKEDLSTAEACSYLSSVGLCAADYISRGVDASLSGGELKRIEIATVIARGKRLSLFDEPEAGIDLWSFNHLTQIFEEMHESITDSTIIIISHQERILDIADKIIVLAQGEVVQVGTKEEVLPTLLDTASADSCLLKGVEL